MKIAYLGPKGTFTETALKHYTKRDKTHSFESVPCSSLVDVFDKIVTNEVDEVIVPIENSVEGSVNATMDLLTDTTGIYLKEEVVLPIHQNLMTKSKVDIQSIDTVVSHVQALAQCQRYMHEHMPHAKTYSVPSTAIAAKWLHDGELERSYNSNNIAIIGNQELAELYGLNVLAKEVNDSKRNATSFMVISKKETKPTGNDRTAIIFSTIKDKPGGLYDALGEFATRGINLTKIISRPTRTVLGEYLFFVDCEGHMAEQDVKDALAAIKTKASFFKCLGSYRKDHA